MRSNYGLKLRGQIEPRPHVRPEYLRKRVCTQCRKKLPKGHGFPSQNGRGLYCGGCRFPR